METNGCHLQEQQIKEAVIENGEPDPNDISDWQYKEWLESKYVRECEAKVIKPATKYGNA